MTGERSWRNIWGLATRYPVTAALALFILIFALLTGPLRGPEGHLRSFLGTGADRFTAGHWWSPITAVLFTTNLLELVVGLAAVIVFVGFSERLMGSLRTLLAYFGTAFVGISVGVGIQIIGTHSGELWSRNLHHLVVFDVFTAVAGTIMTASAFASTLWRRRIRVITLLVVIMYVLYSGMPSDLYRLLAALCGLGLGVLLRPYPRTVTGWQRSSHHEMRVLLASVVSISVLGPVIALTSGSRYGVLAPIGALLTSDAPDAGHVLQRCQAFAITHGCVHELTLTRINGFGPVLISISPLLVLIVAAYGLLHGRRFAVWLAVALNVMLAILAALYFGIFPLVNPRNDVTPHYWEVSVILAMSAIVPAALAVLLIVLRRHFTVLTPRRAIYRYILLVAVSWFVLAFLYVLIGWLERNTGFTRQLDLGDLLARVLQRFVPVSFLRHQPIQYLPTTPLTWFVYYHVGTIFWLVVILGALPLLTGRTRVRGGAANAAARARQLLERGGVGRLSFMATWEGNSYWFDAASGGAIAYRVNGRVALTTAGPFGITDTSPGIIERFARFCDDSGFVPVFYSVESDWEPVFQSMGWSTMVVAEETVIRPRSWATTGKKWQDVRTSINRAQRAGIRSEWTTYFALPLSITVQISDISEQWVAEKGLPEMGFTLGGLDELRDPAVRLMLAIDESGRVEGVTSWLPTYRDGEVIGWTLDFMRRRPGSINGVMEFLIAEAAEQMQRDGMEFMSLSGAPLAHTAVAENEPQNALERILGFLSTSLEPVYGFRSLLRFKQKFQPEMHPLIMAYPDPVALPIIGVALVRAYLPELSVRQTAALTLGRAGMS